MITKAPSRAYFDTCCFIDLIKHGQGQQLAKDAGEDQKRQEDCWYLRRMCDASRDGVIRIVTSILTIAECTNLGDGKPLSEETKNTIDAFLTFGTVVDLIEADIFVAEEARRLYWNHDVRLKGADAIHVATGIIERCAEFITTDRKILHQGSRFTKSLPDLKKHIRVRRASQTNILPNEYRTGDLFASDQEEDEDE